jgi:hypothetical protein
VNRKFSKQPPKTVATRQEAKAICDNAQAFRRSGTPDGMVCARAADELLERLTIIEDN